MQISLTKVSDVKKLSVRVILVSQQKSGKQNKLKMDDVSKETTELIEAAAKAGEFEGKANECQLYRNANLEGATHLLFVGLGDTKAIDEETLRSAAGTTFKALKSVKAASSAVSLDQITGFAKSGAQAFVEGLQLSDYSMDEYKTAKDKKQKTMKLSLLYSKAPNATLKKQITSAETIAECVNFSKRLGDLPGNKMTPEILANEVVNAAKGTKLKVTVWDKARIKKERFGGLMGVNLGSANDPRFIIMKYTGNPSTKKHVAFVGKGLTFDAGGISIKPSAGMDEMRYDMCGGANVIGTLLAVAKLGLKVNVVGYVPSTENMLGGLATKPGDILTFRNGKTAEVLNTDAEGRLILADGLSYASEQKPAAIVDAATLTGAMVVALGNTYTGFFTTDEKVRGKVEEAGKESGENVWAMPIHKDHHSDMKGQFADLSNISSFRGAGSSTAAAFLSNFVGEGIPYVHFDIAGTAWNCGNRLSYVPPKGATGCMIRTFVELAKKL